MRRYRTVEVGGARRTATNAMARPAEGVQGLVTNMRAEQQMIRAWVEEQTEESREMRRVLVKLVAPEDLPEGWREDDYRTTERPGE